MHDHYLAKDGSIKTQMEVRFEYGHDKTQGYIGEMPEWLRRKGYTPIEPTETHNQTINLFKLLEESKKALKEKEDDLSKCRAQLIEKESEHLRILKSKDVLIEEYERLFDEMAQSLAHALTLTKSVSESKTNQ